MTEEELVDRRKILEKFVQSISQVPAIAKSPLFVNFFNNAQKEVQVADLCVTESITTRNTI